MPNAFYIDAHRRIPFYFIEFFEGRERQAAIKGRIVDQDVDSAELLDDRCCHFRSALRTAYVGLSGEARGAFLLDDVERFAAIPYVIDRDAGTKACELASILLSESARGARDNDHPVSKVHWMCLI